LQLPLGLLFTFARSLHDIARSSYRRLSLFPLSRLILITRKSENYIVKREREREREKSPRDVVTQRHPMSLLFPPLPASLEHGTGRGGGGGTYRKRVSGVTVTHRGRERSCNPHAAPTSFSSVSPRGNKKRSLGSRPVLNISGIYPRQEGVNGRRSLQQQVHDCFRMLGGSRKVAQKCEIVDKIATCGEMSLGENWVGKFLEFYVHRRY